MPKAFCGELPQYICKFSKGEEVVPPPEMKEKYFFRMKTQIILLLNFPNTRIRIIKNNKLISNTNVSEEAH